MDFNEIKQSQDEIAGLVSDIQKTHKGILDENKSNKDTLANMQKTMEDFSTKYDSVVAEFEEEKKAREELELAMSKIKVKSSDSVDSVSNPEYKRAFANYLWNLFL